MGDALVLKVEVRYEYLDYCLTNRKKRIGIQLRKQNMSAVCWHRRMWVVEKGRGGEGRRVGENGDAIYSESEYEAK